MPIAITREVNAGLNQAELTFLDRVPIDVELARRQHGQYCRALAELGCDVVTLPTAPALADSVFIEDTAFVLDEIAVLCRPGARSRRAEVAAVADMLRGCRDCYEIEPPGTIEGGDLLRCGSTIYAGLSRRTNRDGIRQLGEIAGAFGYTVKPVPVRKCLHLKSAVSAVAGGKLLLNPDWVRADAFENAELIETAPGEAHAANALLLENGVIYPSSFPGTLEKLRGCGIDVYPVDVGELQKAEGAVTCCSLILA